MHLEKHLTASALQTLVDQLRARAGELATEVTLAWREVNVLCRRQNLLALLTLLRDDAACQFKQLVDISGADYPNREKRFDVVYHLLSLSLNQRVRVRVQVQDGASVPSAVGVFPNANWYEREVYDMFGVSFENHPDLRRILSDYDFAGHPLRKDFPLEGEVELFYDPAQGRCVYRPTALKQEFRHFDQVSTWAGMGHNAHLAEEDKPFSLDEFAAPTEAPKA